MSMRLNKNQAVKWLEKNGKYLLLAGILLFSYILRIKYSYGLFMENDDFLYVKHAYSIATGSFSMEYFNWADFRFLIYAPAGILMWLFGVNISTVMLWHVLCSLGSVLMTYKIGKFLIDRKTGIVAALLMSFYPINVVEIRFLPDSAAVFFMLISVFFFLKFHEQKQKVEYLFISALIMGSCFFIRENSFMLIFFYLGYIICNKKFYKEYIYVGAGCILCFVLYGIILFLLTGDFLFHLRPFVEVITSRGALKLPVLEELMRFRWAELLLGQDFLKYPLKYNYFFTNAFLFGAVYLLFRKDKKVHVPLIWFFSLYLYFEFLSPMHSLRRISRYMMPLVPPLLIVLARFLTWISFENKRYRFQKYIGRVVAILILVLLARNSLNSLKYGARRRDAMTLNRKVKEIYCVLKKHPKRDVYSNDYLVARKLNLYFNNKLFLAQGVRGSRWKVYDRIKDSYFVFVENNLARCSYSNRKQKNGLNKIEEGIILSDLKLVESVREGIGIYYVENMEKSIDKGIETVIKETRREYSNKKYKEAYKRFHMLCPLFPENMEFKTKLRISRHELYKKNHILADVCLKSNGTTIEGSSPCYGGYGVEAAIDGVERKEKDYLSVRYYKMPNWFILNFNRERMVHDIEIKWHTPELYGRDWRVEYFDGEEWKLLKEENDWAGNEKGIYYYKFPEPIIAYKVKLVLTRAAGQNRMLIDRFSMDYSETRAQLLRDEK